MSSAVPCWGRQHAHCPGLVWCPGLVMLRCLPVGGAQYLVAGIGLSVPTTRIVSSPLPVLAPAVPVGPGARGGGAVGLFGWRCRAKIL